jgi:polar amino acid transport system ATP-binding protein
MENETILKVNDLHKRYDALEVLKGISFELKKGEKVVIMGRSGAGKSTLLRCINRLIEPDAGEIHLGDTRVTATETDVTKIRRRIGMVFQHFELFSHLTALDNVTIGPIKVLNLPKEEAMELGLRYLDKVGLKSKAHSFPAELSGGEKQRVGIARALAMNPDLVMFDEPTSALDPLLVGEVLDTMKELAKEGLTMLIVTHEVDFAKEVADRIMIMNDGEIVDEGPPSLIFSDPKHEFTRRFLQRTLS